MEQDVEQLRQEVAELKATVGELSNSIGDLVAAWNAAGFMVGLVKWVAGFAAAVLGAWAAWTKIRGS